MDEAFGDELEQAFTDWDAEQDAGQDDLEANKCNNDDAEANALERTIQATQPPTEGSAASAATPDARPRLHLLQLPREMLLRVMSLLPATGLTAAACTCRLLSELASEDAVWRRLYLCRWGKPEQHVRANGKQWKRTYLDADGEEWEATRRQHQDLDLDLAPAPKPKPGGSGAAGPTGGGGSSRAAGRCRGSGGAAAAAAAAATTGSAAGGTPAATPSRGAAASAASGAACGAAGASGSVAPGAVSCVGLGAMFLDMLRAKRDTAPDRRQLDDRMMGADPGDIAAKVAAWRRARGFEGPGAAGPSGSGASGSGASGSAPQAPPRPDLSHRGRAALTFTRVNPGEEPPVYACEQTGWVHVCGDACTEGVVDARSELLVCPVSGQTTDRLVHECEEDEAGGCGGAGGAAGGEEDGLGLGITAGFGRYFTAGYECENAQQLNRLLGYKAL
ncbi:hypothetical protein CHLRE_01g021200v5 [Chlamydomonas reinhardtii]|uniref:F-box domain-containing protein n=1 Tax=Chlamydomonas reinhardtii TaxID=3055 RepID=A0A2K3E642_CHLRE|nr:uncharacterized protein CHLRE_01g021200v5 [Chlamydomonas reinhardtii]PNW88250.1 hypothetical protein CHLRE_01g021200v5 [Chlamydomonas reinhardtii]